MRICKSANHDSHATFDSNPDIIIKPADKGSATVIMNKSDYINEGYRQLNDVRYYKQIPNHIYLETSEKVTDILYDLCKKQVISHKASEFYASVFIVFGNFAKH